MAHVQQVGRVVRNWLLASLIAVMVLSTGCAEDAPCTQVASSGSTSAPAPLAEPYRSGEDPYTPGSLTVRTIDIATCDRGAPVALRIHAPESPGTYAVVVFQHGFFALTYAYDVLLGHLASHGFIVLAPQMYLPTVAALLGQPTSAEEAQLGVQVLNWLPAHLSEVTGVQARTDLLGLAGHSRGGKMAWIILSTDPGLVQAFAGVDPVDGSDTLSGNPTPVVHGPLSYSLPALIIGSGLRGNCTHEGEDHEKFYAACRPPAWHVVAPDYGHADFLNDLEAAAAAALVCPSGPDPAAMRRLTAGLLVAFFRGTLQGDPDAFRYLTDAAAAPVRVEIESK